MNLPLLIGLRYTGARRKSRSVSFLSAVSMTGLAVGVALLILVLSVMNGFERELQERILGLVPQATIYHRTELSDWQTTRDAAEANPSVVAAAPFVSLNGLVSYRKYTSSVLLYGFDPSLEGRVSRINEFVSEATQQRIDNNEAVMILGKGVADSLSVSSGEKVMVIVPSAKGYSRSPTIAYFEIAEIIESQTELDATLALTSIGRAAALAGIPHGVSGLKLKLSDLFAAPSIMFQVVMGLGPEYYSSNWTRTHWNLYQAIRMSKNLVGLLMSLIVGIAAFNVVSTLVLVVIDKQGDIAILRTLGLGGPQIMAIFMIQGTIIGVLGSLVGVVIGVILASGAQHFVSLVESLFHVQFLQSDVYPLTYLPTEIRIDDMIVVVGTAMGMSILATIYPAWKATTIQPAQALRYE